MKRWRRRLKPFLSFLPAVLILIFIFGLIKLQIFNIKKIGCVLDGYPCPLAFEPALVGLHNQNLFTLKTVGTINYLRALDPTLTEINFNRQLPNRVQLNLKRSPAIAYVTKNGDWFHLDVLGNLVVLPERPNLVLPVIFLPEELNIEPLKLSELVNALTAAPVSFSEINWERGDFVVIKTVFGSLAVVDPTKALSPAIASLQYILSNLKIGEKLPTTIDLRFDKPILSY